MKTFKLSVPLALLFSMLAYANVYAGDKLQKTHSSPFPYALHNTKALAKQTDVALYITLPDYYQQNTYFNFWTITFVKQYTYETYTFTTNNDHYPNGYLGTLPEGIYRVTFQQDSGPNNLFDFLVGGRYRSDGNQREYYGCEINATNNLILIDAID